MGGEDEIELELGLSLGGNYNTRLQKLVPVQNGAHAPKSGPFSTDLGFGVQGCARSGGSSGFAGPDSEDPRTKREIQALRRQEAKKKRGEKQLKRALSKGKVAFAAGCSYLNGGTHHDPEEPVCKKSKTGLSRSDRADSMSGPESANVGVEPALQRILTAPLQFGVPAHGFGHTGSGFVGGGVEGNVIQVCVEPGRSIGNGHDPEQNGGSNVSATCASSVGSDYRSSSREGPGGSSDSRSHSMQSILEQPQLNGGSSSIKSQSEQTATSDIVESASEALNCEEAIKMSLNGAQSDPHKRTEESKSEIDGMNTSGVENPERENNHQQVGCKPPRSPNQCENNGPTALPYMPCVSTTGNGPNGKTVHGFLYRYTKAEVSIICVCHGSSFSPMEFVQHAGGIDVSYPLKHITVVPSAI